MRYLSMLAVFCIFALPGQTLPENEQASLQRAMGEAGTNPLEIMRALEDHLNRFPNSPRKADFERVLVKTAIEAKDSKRIARFGERVLALQPDDPQLLQQVASAL